MKQAIINIRDEVWCTVSGLMPEDNTHLWEHLGVFVEGYRWMPAFKLGRWDGKIRFFEKTGKTYWQLLDEIVPKLDKWGYEITVNDTRVYHAPPTKRATLDQFSEFGIGIRQYQVDTINELIEAGSAFAIAATGSGKSLISASLCDCYNSAGYKTITIVPSADLVVQTVEWFGKCGLEVGQYSGDKKEIDKMNVIATWQALQNAPHYMENFHMVIIDEGHQGKCESISKLINENGKNISFRFGLTGTFPKPAAEQYALRSAIGPIIKEIPASWLIENGYLAKIDIEIIQTVEKIEEEFPDYPSEKAYISKSQPRMEFIADLIISKCKEYGNSLVLVNSIPFGEKLAAMIEGATFLYGASKKDERKEQYDMFEKNDNHITIASSGIASTGISIDRVFCLLLIDPGKSFIKSIQSCGRSLRLAHDKKSVHVVDVSANLKYAKGHLNTRKKWYKEATYPYSGTIKVKL